MTFIYSALFGIFGLATGYLLQRASNKIVSYKASIKNMEVKGGYCESKAFMIFVCMANCFFWTLSSTALPSIFERILISLLFSLGIMFVIIDLRIRIIPNELILVTFIAGVIFHFLHFGLNSLAVAFMCMVALMGAFIALGLVIGLHKIGAGDVKLIGITGVISGYPHILTAVLFMSISTFIYAVSGLIAGKLTKKSRFPYAPFIVLGMTASLIGIMWNIEPGRIINLMLNGYSSMLKSI